MYGRQIQLRGGADESIIDSCSFMHIPREEYFVEMSVYCSPCPWYKLPAAHRGGRGCPVPMSWQEEIAHGEFPTIPTSEKPNRCPSFRDSLGLQRQTEPRAEPSLGGAPGTVPGQQTVARAGETFKGDAGWEGRKNTGREAGALAQFCAQIRDGHS